MSHKVKQESYSIIITNLIGWMIFCPAMIRKRLKSDLSENVFDTIIQTPVLKLREFHILIS